MSSRRDGRPPSSAWDGGDSPKGGESDMAEAAASTGREQQTRDHGMPLGFQRGLSDSGSTSRGNRRARFDGLTLAVENRTRACSINCDSAGRAERRRSRTLPLFMGSNISPAAARTDRGGDDGGVPVLTAFGDSLGISCSSAVANVAQEVSLGAQLLVCPLQGRRVQAVESSSGINGMTNGCCLGSLLRSERRVSRPGRIAMPQPWCTRRLSGRK